MSEEDGFGPGPDPSAAAPPAVAPPAPRRRSRVLIGALIGVCAAALAAVILLGGGGSSGPTLAMAATATKDAPGFKFSDVSAISVAGHSLNLTGSGYSGDHGHQGSLSFSGGPLAMTMLTDYPYTYMQLPTALMSKLGVSTPWARVNKQQLAAAAGIEDAYGGPDQLLRYLDGAGGASAVGTEQVDGVSTTHLHTSITFSQYMQATGASGKFVQKLTALLSQIGVSSIPLDVWVDGQSHIRRMELRLNGSLQGTTLSETITMNLSDYGPQPPVTPPPAGQYTDVPAQSLAQLAPGLL
jgi:hypothetical protein